MIILRRAALSAFLFALPAAVHAGCDDFDTQADAQRAMTMGDYSLDTQGNGIACEAHFSQPDSPSRNSGLTCAGFFSRNEAQRAYQTGARHLDADRNGRACDSPGNLVSEAPSIASTCADFTTQEQAQAAFVTGITELDPDDNGLACEHLPNIEELGASDDVDKLGSPSFKWQRNDLGVQPRTSGRFTAWPSD
jgi:hypothetical protein